MASPFILTWHPSFTFGTGTCMIVCLSSIKRGKITVWLSIDAVTLNT